MSIRPSLFFFLFVLLPAPVWASALCTLGEARRSVEVEPAPGGASVPCAVRYTKESGGHDQVLWRAQSDRLYCEKKAALLIGRLRDAGWACKGDEPGVARPLPAREAPTTPPADPAPPRARVEVPAVATSPLETPAVSAPPPPIARIEAPPPAFEPEPLSLRERIVLDPRMRFYRSSFGDAALGEALHIVPVDLNADGRDELFLQVDLPELCGETACTWDLFELRPDGALATLGVRGVVDWRALPERSNGYPDLAVRFISGGEAEYGVLRFELGMYRVIEQSATSEVFASDVPQTTIAP